MSDTTLYRIVRNAEEQYSIWPSFKPVPDGWGVIGEPDTKDNCLEFIGETWKDMRPRSLREKLVDGIRS